MAYPSVIPLPRRMAIFTVALLVMGCGDSTEPDLPGLLVVVVEPAATQLDVIAWGQQESATASPARSALEVVIERTDQPFNCSVFGYARVTLEDGRVGLRTIDRPVPEEYPPFYCSLDPGETLEIRVVESELQFGEFSWPP